MDPYPERDEEEAVEDEEEAEEFSDESVLTEDDSDDSLSSDSGSDSDSNFESDRSSDRDNEYSYEYPSCDCKRCTAYKDLREFYHTWDEEEPCYSKFIVFHYAHYLFKVTDIIDLPVAIEFFPKLFRKIKEIMKFSLQEDLVGLLYFPGHGYLPHTVVLQIVEIMLDSSIADRDMDIMKFEENPPFIRHTLSEIYGNLDEFFQFAISANWPPYWPQLKLKPGLCEVKIKCNTYVAIQILFLLDDLKVIKPDFSLEEEQYRRFIGEFKVDQFRERLESIMNNNLHRTLGLKEKENLTTYVYALRMTYDNVADILTPHVEIQDIVTMCKIFKSTS